jgi:hypothetical protein
MAVEMFFQMGRLKGKDGSRQAMAEDISVVPFLSGAAI